MVHAIGWYGPATDSQEDQDASERALEFQLGFWANPIYHGDFPDVIKERVTDGRLPVFTDEEKVWLKGTSDYFCINSYSSDLVKNRASTSPPEPNKDSDVNVDVLPDSGHPVSIKCFYF